MIEHEFKVVTRVLGVYEAGYAKIQMTVYPIDDKPIIREIKDVYVGEIITATQKLELS